MKWRDWEWTKIKKALVVRGPKRSRIGNASPRRNKCSTVRLDTETSMGPLNSEAQ